jgi:hypothetical protein
MSKTYQQFMNEQEDLNEGIWRNLGAVGLTNKIRTIDQQLQNIKISSTDSIPSAFQKLDKKIDLLSQQQVFSAALIAQTAIMEK